MMNYLTHYGIIEEKGGFMDVSYTLGRFLGKFINRLSGLNFFLKLYLAYILVSNVTLYREDFTDLVAYSAVALSFAIAGIFYYVIVLCFRGTLRSVINK
jgi:hypothetical protein